MHSLVGCGVPLGGGGGSEAVAPEKIHGLGVNIPFPKEKPTGVEGGSGWRGEEG